MGVRACILSISGPELLKSERNFLRQANPWGLILMGRSCENREQLKRLCNEIRNCLGYDVLIFIDQEGGRVARLRPPHWPAFPPAAAFGDLYAANKADGLEAAYLGHRLIADELRAMGINADCAPVCDLRVLATHDAIGDRAFSASADAVKALAKRALKGLSDGGVQGCLKHMPGQGRAEADSHYDLPKITTDIAELDTDFDIFSELSGHALMGMTGHVCYEAIAPGEPATISDAIISGVIRQRIGFDGILMTDDLGMNALGDTLAVRGNRALAAGCDVLLHCSGFLKSPDDILAEMESVADCAGELEGVSLTRANKVTAGIGQPDEFDRDASRRRFSDLMHDRMNGVG